ncbi:60S ribosomal protein L19 precursor [Purpureocillium lavendulum]|uniref:60S ribosomal protein L19 n=1 Tax=Purpureocillium lavendulum TaxID=1247861 RepID=A0AB34G8A8_9HYPO|nr:60S ribosomal protein L19 precursor [Purpureocillium lavendulum]
MKLTSLSAFAALVASALAADCTGNFLGSPTTDLYWEVRTRMCDQNAPFACPYQQDCQQGAQAKFDTFTFSVQLIRKNTDGVKGFKDCWDATEDIINQCIASGLTDGGTWKYEGQSFEYKAYYV